MSPSLITVRPYQPSDQQAIAELIVSIQREEFDIAITLEEQADLADIDGFYTHGCGGFWVAVCDDKIVGSVALLDITNNQAALRKMFVAKEHRGADKGVAVLLLNHLTDQARSLDVKEIYLGTTSDFVAAHRFYEKNGFNQYSKTDLPARFPIMAVDSRFYRLDL